MTVLKGIPVAPGLASGTAIVYDFEVGRKLCVPSSDVPRCNVAQEWKRLDEALEESSRDLTHVASLAGEGAGNATSLSLLTAHAAMTAEIASLVKKQIDSKLVNVEQALDSVIGEWVERLTRLDSEYLRQREQDVRDVGRRIARYLAGSMPWSKGPVAANSIVVARELLPSEAVELANCGVLAIVSDHGGRYNHTAILARALEIPMVTGIADASRLIQPGTPLLLDGEAGLVVTYPTTRERDAFSEQMKRLASVTSTQMLSIVEPCVTRDGVAVELAANIGGPEEIPLVAEQRLDAVRLLRTEFLFMQSHERPDTQTQIEMYTCMARGLEGRPLVVRTFDLGGDKLPPFLAAEDSGQHRGLHLGGLRFSLTERRLFESQLKAVLSVSQEYDLHILLPMVVGADDFSRAVSTIQQVADRCGSLRVPPIGAMIETPAALFSIDEILDLADFVALGTNDLTQYLLATDRDLAVDEDDCTAMHPAVLRAIKTVVDAATRLQCPLCVCGEEVNDPGFAGLLVGFGVRALSLSPKQAPDIRAAIRQIDSRDAHVVAERALSCHSVADVKALIAECGLSAAATPGNVGLLGLAAMEEQ